MVSLNGSAPKPAGPPRAFYIVIGNVDMRHGKVRLLNCPERRYTISNGDLLQLTTGGVVCAVAHPQHSYVFWAFNMLTLEKIAARKDYDATMARAAWYTQ